MRLRDNTQQLHTGLSSDLASDAMMLFQLSMYLYICQISLLVHAELT